MEPAGSLGHSKESEVLCNISHARTPVSYTLRICWTRNQFPRFENCSLSAVYTLYSQLPSISEHHLLTPPNQGWAATWWQWTHLTWCLIHKGKGWSYPCASHNGDIWRSGAELLTFFILYLNSSFTPLPLHSWEKCLRYPFYRKLAGP